MSKYPKRNLDDEVHPDYPRRQHRKLPKAKSSDSEYVVDTDHSVTIFTLPIELHRCIFSHIEFIEDVVCLGLTSRYFWSVAQEHVHDYYASLLGQWAGTNIVCVGEHVRPGDFPPGLFTVEEADELRQKTVDMAYYDDYDDDETPFTLNHFTHPSVSDEQEDTDVKSESLRLYFHCEGRSKNLDPAIKSSFKKIVVEDSIYLPQDQPWILRNLMTKEFVRSEAIALKPEFIHGPNIDAVGFGEAIMLRSCWSTSSSINMDDALSHISRGVWAGHCFDITTFAKHEDEIKKEEWRDVSEEVASEIGRIWESEYGPDWREILCKRQSYR